MKDWSTKGIQGYVMLMLEYLKLSPTYELARKYRTGKLTANEKKLLPSDFDQVLKTYDEYGDISTVKFADWWVSTGIGLYGSEYIKPQVRQIANIEKNEEFEPGFTRALEHYFKTIRKHEGSGPGLILAIPLGMPKKTILKEVARMIGRAGVTVLPKAQKASRPLAAARLRSKPLFIGLSLLTFKARFPNKENWRLGVMAGVSPKNAAGLDINAKKNTVLTTDQRINMTILTCRALKKAQYIAENAARGSFPNSKPIVLPEFEWGDILQRLRLSKTIR